MTLCSLRRVLVAGLLGLLMLGVLPGCSQVKVEARGTLPSPDKLALIQDGVTSRDALIAAFGEPQGIKLLDGGRELLVYQYSETEDADTTYVPLILRTAHSRTRLTRTFFEVANGVVTRHWQEQSN